MQARVCKMYICIDGIKVNLTVFVVTICVYSIQHTFLHLIRVAVRESCVSVWVVPIDLHRMYSFSMVTPGNPVTTVCVYMGPQ